MCLQELVHNYVEDQQELSNAELSLSPTLNCLFMINIYIIIFICPFVPLNMHPLLAKKMMLHFNLVNFMFLQDEYRTAVNV